MTNTIKIRHWQQPMVIKMIDRTGTLTWQVAVQPNRDDLDTDKSHGVSWVIHNHKFAAENFEAAERLAQKIRFAEQIDMTHWHVASKAEHDAAWDAVECEILEAEANQC